MPGDKCLIPFFLISRVSNFCRFPICAGSSMMCVFSETKILQLKEAAYIFEISIPQNSITF